MAEIKLIKEKHFFPGTYGLVVCGGNSSRMGVDKSMLQYYEKPQRYHVYDLLIPLCEKVFISCNAAQSNTIKPGYFFLTDLPVYNNIGPMAALLTTFAQFPTKNTLMIGCDYPFLTSADLQQFSLCCKEKNKPVSFYNEKENIYEPLLAWYPYTGFKQLKITQEAGQFSLRHFLKESQAVKFCSPNKNSMVSIDTQEAYIQACNIINP